MNDFDLDRLGDVWRQQPDPAETERLRRSAAAARRRAHWGQLIDVASALAVGGVVLILILLNPARDTLVVGTGAILILLISNTRQRRLRQIELRSLTGSTEDMLDQAIERVEATIKRTRFTLAAIGPSLLIGGVFAAAAGFRRGGAILPALNDIFLLRVIWLGITIVAIVGFVIYSAFALRRGRRELERLTQMRETYRHERESTTN
jgi:hypothetical protein